MTMPPLLGLALTIDDFAPLADWICGPGRAIEIQDFVAPDVIAGDPWPLVEAWARLLPAHTGPRGIHGPFFGLDVANPDPDLRAIIRRRFLTGLAIAERLGATQMVIHSPFNWWQVLNRRNYAGLYQAMCQAAADCLAPVLARAADTGCILVIENLDDTDPEDRVRLVRQIGHPNLRVSLDTGHAELAHARYGAPAVVDFIAAAGDLLGHVHLQDVDGHADRHWHPGDGRIPWGPVLRALAAQPAPPRLILEVRDDRTRLPQTVARLSALGLAV